MTVRRRHIHQQDDRSAHGRVAAFTLVELLIVIAVIGILIGLIGLVGSHVAEHNKVRFTQTIMRNTQLAIDAFSETNPLASIYDRPNARTFGSLPPYQLFGTANDTVGGVLEPNAPNNLPDRLWRDLGSRQSPDTKWVRLRLNADENDDIRALYAYLAIYVPDALAQVPRSAIKPLAVSPEEFINPKGDNSNPKDPNSAWINIFAIHDAWGVPLDYLVYAKYEVVPSENSSAGKWQVTDRLAALRSRGISAEVYEAAKADKNLSEHEGLFSDTLPGPHLKLADKNNGAMPAVQSQSGGWARVRAGWGTQANEQEDYSYVP